MTTSRWRQLIVYFLGIILLSFGTACSARSLLGVAPTNIIAYVLSLIFKKDHGHVSTLYSWSFVMLQILLLRRRFKMRNLIQIPVAYVFGSLLTLWNNLLSQISIHTYWQQLLLLVCSIIIVSFGIVLFLSADYYPLPPDAFLLTLVAVQPNWKYAHLKSIYDLGCTALAIAFGLIFTGKLSGVREGTIISALAVGPLVSMITKWLMHPLQTFMTGKQSIKF